MFHAIRAGLRPSSFFPNLRFVLLPALIGFAISLWPSAASAQIVPLCAEGCLNGYSVDVTPDDSVVTYEKNTTHTVIFNVNNSGSHPGSWSLWAASTGGITVLSTSSNFVSLGIDQDAQVSVTFKVGTTTTERLMLVASGNAKDTGSVAITAIAGTAPTVTLVVPTLTSGSRAVVRNRQPIIRALIDGGSTVDTAATTLKWRGSTVSGLARRGRRLIEWEVDSTRWLGIGDSALIEAQACSIGGACSSWVTRWAVLPNDSLPVLGFTGAPLEALGAGFSAPFGPGFTISGGEVETGFSTVPYVSVGQPRSTGLVYSTRQSYPRVLLPVDLELPWPSGTPDSIRLTVIDGGTRRDSVKFASPSCATGAVKRCRVVLPVDYSSSSFSTPTRKWLKVEVTVKLGATIKMSVDSIEAVLVDRRSTRYGSGWWPSAEMLLVAAGSDRVLVAPNGAATIYRGSGDSSYIAPPGVFTALTKVGTGWELRTRGSSGKLVFDSQGRLSQSIDPNFDTVTVKYNATNPDQVDTIVDPVHMKITFTYSSGKLTTITSLPGAAGRNAKVTINGSNQLVYDSVSSDPAKPFRSTLVYTTYPGTNTVVLSKRIGTITDTTIVTYDSTFKRRPASVRLPQVKDETGANVNPVISYTAYERQGYGSLRSLDSVYVEIKDPRNNWTRSLLNRWGQSRKSWDALGLLGRSDYDPDGLARWSEGKVADSSRTYYAYDAFRRLLKSYIVRGAGDTLRGDSLVYDSTSRVVQQVDNRGNIWRTDYDSVGNVLRTVTPTSDTSRYLYNIRGQLTYSYRPGIAAPARVSYDASWSNVAQTLNEVNQVMSTHYLDQYGRDTSVVSAVQVQVTGTTTAWQWRGSRTFFNAANQVDSARVRRGNNCADPCTTLDWGGAGLDAAHMQIVRHLYDHAGRDSIRTNSTGGKSAYYYDRLGRVVKRLPWADSTAVFDSLTYDIGGNLKKAQTRRGDVITTDYDSRNRDTLTVIPTVGTVRKSFAGPLDQLTRLWLTGAIDSIGGVNGELRWGFDQRGRLKADTAYTGATARSTIYTYDSWERASTSTDPSGAWTTRYEALRGYTDTLITPFGDTVSYTFDAQGRRVGPRIAAGSNPVMALAPRWSTTGQLDSLKQLSGANTVGLWKRRSPNDVFGDDGQSPALVPSWLDPMGSIWTDSVNYDGWERVTTLVQYKGGTPIRRDSLWFDQQGNVRSTALADSAEVYDAKTDRLIRQKVAGVWDTLSYDRAGNLIRRARGTTVFTYGYDALNRLVSVHEKLPAASDSLIARYGYDLVGRRIAKKVYISLSGGTVGYTRFYYHGGNVAFETDEAGTIGLRYTWGPGSDNLLGVRNAAGTQYYAVQDKLGSVRGVVRRDGTVIMSLAYSAYGTQIDSAGAGLALRYKWTGREYDAETGWYYFRARYYNPTARRFVQEDPAGYGGGANLYAYVNGEVLQATDPSGLVMDYLQSKMRRDQEAEGASGQASGLGYLADMEQVQANQMQWAAEQSARFEVGRSPDEKVAEVAGPNGTTTTVSCSTMPEACKAWEDKQLVADGVGTSAGKPDVVFAGVDYDFAGPFGGFTITAGTYYEISAHQWGYFVTTGPLGSSSLGISFSAVAGFADNIDAFRDGSLQICGGYNSASGGGYGCYASNSSGHTYTAGVAVGTQGIVTSAAYVYTFVYPQ